VDSEPQNTAEAIIDFATTSLASKPFDAASVGAAPYLDLPKGRHVESLKPILDQFRERPEAAVGFARLDTADSFIDHIKRHAKAISSVVFGHRDTSRFHAIYDYHDNGLTGRDDNGSGSHPGWCRHGSIYACPFSEEWKAWVAGSKNMMAGVQFAEFLQERIMDIVETPVSSPSFDQIRTLLGGMLGTPAQIMDLSRNLTINVGAKVRQAINLSTGEVSLAYDEQHSDGEGQPVKVPTLFAIGIPVYRGGVRYQIAMRLRYRLDAGKVLWGYQLHRADESLDVAFAEVARKVAEGTHMPVFMGTQDTGITVPS